MFWEHGEVTLGGVEGLELRLVGSWNKQVSHYHVSETGTKERANSVCSSDEVKGFRDEMCWIVDGVVWKERDSYGRMGLSDGQRKRVFVYI